MPVQLQSSLIFHGAIVFLLGMLAGFPYAFVLLADLAEDGSTCVGAERR